MQLLFAYSHNNKNTKHGTVGHDEATATTIISGHKSTVSSVKLNQLKHIAPNISANRDSSNYLDSWSKNKTTNNNIKLENKNEKKNSVIIRGTNENKKEENNMNSHVVFTSIVQTPQTIRKETV